MIGVRSQRVIVLSLGVLVVAAGCKKKVATKPAAATNPPVMTKPEPEPQPVQPPATPPKITSAAPTTGAAPAKAKPAAAKRSTKVKPKPAPAKKQTPAPATAETQFSKPRPSIEITPGGKTDETLQHPELSTEQLQVWVEEKIKSVEPSPNATVQQSIDQAKSFLQTSRDAAVHGDMELAHNLAVKAYVLLRDVR